MNDAVAWQQEIRLEENESVINVTPRLAFDPHGGFLIADREEAQLRRYASDGTLLQTYGREGEGPAEFERPVAALRLPSGAVLGVDGDGSIARFDSTGALRGAGQLPFGAISDVDLLGDSALLVAGRRTDEPGPQRLHVWDLAAEQVLQSYFEPPRRPIGAPLTASVGPTHVAAVAGLSDTLYVFTTDGEPVRTVPLPAEHLRRYQDPETRPPSPDWPYSFSIVYNAFWLADGSIVVQYFDFQREANAAAYRLLHMTPGGEPGFELIDTPRLLAVGPDGADLVFVAPESLTPNRLRVGRLGGLD